ncbi:MAG: FtsX-like permease family protein [Pseudomonadota bacterium]
MDVRWKKIWRDLTLRKARVAITLLGLAIGLWGIGSVIVAQRVLGDDLTTNFTRTVPPHLVVPMRGLDNGMLERIKALDGVVAAENRPILGARLAIGAERHLPLILFVVDDFAALDVAKVFPDYGTYPPPPGSVLIERDGRPLIRIMGGNVPSAAPGGHGAPQGEPAARGDDLQLSLPDGSTVIAPLAGTVFDPGQAPSRMEMMVYGYVDRATASGWLPGGFGDRLIVRARDDGFESRLALRDAVAAVIADGGGEAFDFILPAPDEHPHQFQMNTILTLLLGMGTLGFLLSAVLITNLVTVMLTNQIREIGTLKAIGGSVAQVMALYLGGMLLLGLVASLLVLPLVVRSGYGLAWGMSMMLNFEVLTTTLPIGFYAILVGLGALFPVVAAFVPVRRWCSVPVRAALDNHGAAPPMDHSAIARLTASLPLTLRLGVRNAFRVPRRFVLSALTLAVGTVVFLFAMNLRASLLNTAEVEDERWNHDLTVRLAERMTPAELAWIEGFPWAEPVELWDAGAAELLETPVHGSARFGLVAVPADTRAFVPKLTAGTWPGAGDTVGVVASHRFTSHYPGLAVGDRFEAEVAGQQVTFELRGFLKLFGAAALYMDAEGFREITGADGVAGRMLYVTRKPEAELGLFEMQGLLESHFELAGIGVSGVMMSQMATRIIRNHLLVIEVMLGVVAFLMLLVSALGLATGISASVVERTRELGVLRAIGARPGAVYRIVGAEAVFVGLCAWLVAVLLATPVSRRLNDWFGTGVVEYPFDYATSLLGIILSLAVVVVLSLLAAAGPVRAINRQVVREAVAYE